MSMPVSKLKKRWLKKPGFKEGYDALAEEFAPATKFDAFMREIEDEAKADLGAHDGRNPHCAWSISFRTSSARPPTRKGPPCFEPRSQKPCAASSVRNDGAGADRHRAGALPPRKYSHLLQEWSMATSFA